jgi:hypothetical protein
MMLQPQPQQQIDPALLTALQNMQLPGGQEWVMDSGASSHMASDHGILSSPVPFSSHKIIVGNGASLPVTHTGSHTFSFDSKNLFLRNILIVPHIIKNLISVRQFTIDNLCSIEFDPFGFSVKDLLTKTVILRCNSPGPLYSLCRPLEAKTLLATSSSELWHRRLGHPGHPTMQRLHQQQHIPSNKPPSSLCHACQLGRHIRLPFYPSESFSVKPFQLLHCDLWTSPIPSTSGFAYHLIIVDDYTHYFWTFPLRKKSDVYATFTAFHAYARTQFSLPILAIQCDNGREFDNNQVNSFFTQHGTLFRFSCPHTSQQNGKAECAIRTTNNVIHTLLFQASMPPSLWAEALHTATLLINIRPTKATSLSYAL